MDSVIRLPFNSSKRLRFFASIFAVCVMILGLGESLSARVLQVKTDEGEGSLFQEALRSSMGSAVNTDLTAAKFLSMIATGETDDRVYLKWISDLGSESYQERQAAEAQLYSIPILPEKFRRLATSDSDPEIQFRLTAIFENRRNRVEKLLVAAIRTVAAEKDSSVLTNLLFLFDSANYSSVSRELRLAIIHVARIDQEKEFLSRIQSPRAEMRLLCASVLCELDVEGLPEKLAPLLKDDEDSIRYEVARKLIEGDHKIGLKTFCQLIVSKSKSVAFRSERTLSSVTGKDFGRVSFSTPQKNLMLQKKWIDWCDLNADSLELRLPLAPMGKMNGHTLIAINQKLVIELDAERKEVNRLNVDKVLGAEMTIDGNYLLFSYQSQWLRELTPKGEKVWEIAGPKFNNAMALLNGNVLVTIGAEKLVREIDPRTKKTVWECKVDWWANDAYRLENGNTLVGGKGGVVEIAPDKSIAWSYKNESPITIVVAKPVDEGNVLIGWTDGTAKVLNLAKKTVWEYKSKSKLSDVFRDSEGSTFIVKDKEIIELDPDKEIVWRYPKLTGTGTIRR